MLSFKQFIYRIDEKSFLEKYKIKQTSAGLGFSEENQKWYGWGRGICGFGIGDKLFDKNWTPDGSKPIIDNPSTNKLKFTDRGSIVIKNLEQAKQAAINFKNYMS